MPSQTLVRSWARRTLVGLAALVCLALAGLPTPAVAGQAGDENAAARRLYDHAVGLVLAGDTAAGSDELRLLVDQFGGSDLVDEALLELATLYFGAGDQMAAVAAAEQLVADFPRTDGAAGGEVLLAQLHRADAATTADLVALREAVLRVPLLYAADAYPQLPWRAAAHVVAGELALELGDDASAAGNFGMALHDTVEARWALRARIGLARALLAGDDWVAAAEILQPVASQFEGGTELAQRGYRLMGLIQRTRLRTHGGGSPWVSGRLLRNVGSALDRPTGVAASATGNLMVADEGGPFVAQIDAAGTVLWQQKPMNSRGHPWLDRGGIAFFPTEGSVIEPAGRGRFTFLERVREKEEPVEKIVAGARGMFGEWILVHDNGDRVSVFDSAGRFVRSQLPDPRAQITDVEVDGRGNIYLLDRREGRVFRYSNTGQPMGVVVRGTWDRPEALALDDLGNIYVLDRDAKRIDVYRPNGERLAQVGPSLPGVTTLEEPRDLAVDGSGRLFVADRRQQVVVVLE
jgi:TolA-binding protein